MNTDGKSERRKWPRNPNAPTVFEIRAAFHRLWGSQVGQTDYRKRDWQEFQRMIALKFNLKL